MSNLQGRVSTGFMNAAGTPCVHGAIGIESPRKFIAVCAIFGAVVFMGLGWLIDKGYRVKLKEQSTPAAVQNTTYGQQSPIMPNNGGSVTISNDDPKPKQPPPKDKPK